MGLVNVYKMSHLRPFIPYRFKAELWPNLNKEPEPKDILEFTIKNITQPVFKLNSDNKVYFGNTAYVIPIFKFAETSLEITFEETDDMYVYRNLSTNLGANLSKGVNNALINIRITQYSENMLDMVDTKTYICRIKEYTMPTFNNTGFGSPIELKATFNVVYVLDQPRTFGTNKIPIIREPFENLHFDTAIDFANADDDFQDKNLTPFNGGMPNTGARSAEMQKQIDELTKSLEVTQKDLIEKTDTFLNKFYLQNQDAIDKQFNRKLNSDETSDYYKQGLNNYINSVLNNGTIGKSIDLSLLKSEELDEFERSYQKLSNREKFKFATGINTADGLNDAEINQLRGLIDQLSSDDLKDDYQNSLYDILDKNQDLIDGTKTLEELSNIDLRNSGAISSERKFTALEYDSKEDFKTMMRFKSNGRCAANAVTAVSLDLGLEKRLTGTDSGATLLTNDTLINQINASGKGTAKRRNFDIKSVKDLNSLKNLDEFNNGKGLVVSIKFDASKIPADQLEKMSNDSKTYGHGIYIKDGQISGGQKTISTYAFLTDEWIAKGWVTFEFAEVKKNI